MATSFAIDLGALGGTTGLHYAGEATGSGGLLVLGHGAGAPQTHPWMVRMAEALAARGLGVVTFNFLYREKGRGAPDRNDVLEATWRGVIDAVKERERPARLFLGGKSMGGRIATQVAAGREDLAGLVLLGYPLHPPGKPTQLRSKHLPGVKAPMLFVQGSRDAFGTPEELAPVVKGLAKGTRLFVVEGGDHSFARPKRTGFTLEATLAAVADEVARFTA